MLKLIKPFDFIVRCVTYQGQTYYVRLISNVICLDWISLTFVLFLPTAAQIIQERKHQHFLSLGPLSTSSSSLPSTPHSVRSNSFGIPGPYPHGTNTASGTNHSNSGAPPTPTAGRRNLSGGSREGSRDSSQPSPSSTPNFTRKSRRKSNLFTVRWFLVLKGLLLCLMSAQLFHFAYLYNSGNAGVSGFVKL